MTNEQAIEHAEEMASNYEEMIGDYALDSEKLAKCAKNQRQIAAWLRELQERRKADSCEGCKHRTGGDRFWICQKCRRQYEDKYEAERRTDE